MSNKIQPKRLDFKEVAALIPCQVKDLLLLADETNLIDWDHEKRKYYVFENDIPPLRHFISSRAPSEAKVTVVSTEEFVGALELAKRLKTHPTRVYNLKNTEAWPNTVTRVGKYGVVLYPLSILESLKKALDIDGLTFKDLAPLVGKTVGNLAHIYHMGKFPEGFQLPGGRPLRFKKEIVELLKKIPDGRKARYERQKEAVSSEEPDAINVREISRRTGVGYQTLYARKSSGRWPKGFEIEGTVPPLYRAEICAHIKPVMSLSEAAGQAAAAREYKRRAPLREKHEAVPRDIVVNLPVNETTSKEELAIMLLKRGFSKAALAVLQE